MMRYLAETHLLTLLADEQHHIHVGLRLEQLLLQSSPL